MQRITRGAVVIGMLMTLVAGTVPCGGATLEELRSIYESQMARTKSQYSTDAVVAEYATQLESAIKAAKDAGDLMGYMALQKEQERIRVDKTIPSTVPVTTEKRLAQVWQVYGRRMAEIGTVRDRNILTLTQQYVQRLTAEGNALVRSGDTAGAAQMHQEVQRVKASQPVIAAEFSAAAGSRPPAPATATTPSPVAGDAPPVVVKAQKRIAAKGSLTAGWTVTATRVDQGDKVVVTASGRWQCPNVSSPCGPAGYPRTSYLGYSWYGTSLQYVEINYGALLCRIGSGGAVRAVGDRMEFVADAAGPLQFSCNVRDDASLRKQCSGEIDVEIEVERKSGN